MVRKFLIPADGISKDVLRADLNFYLGADAEVVSTNESSRNGNRCYLVEASKMPDQRMIDSMIADSRRWRASNDYDRGKAYSRSRIHDDRTRSGSSTVDNGSGSGQRRYSTTGYTRPRTESTSSMNGYPRMTRVESNRSRHSTRDEPVFEDDSDSAYSSMPNSPPSRYATLAGPHPNVAMSQGRRDSHSAYVEAPRYPSNRRGSEDTLSGMYGWSKDDDDGVSGMYGWSTNRHGKAVFNTSRRNYN